MTRPDVAYHVSFLCQFMKDPSPDAYEAGLGVLSYLNQTKDLGITYGGAPQSRAEQDASSTSAPVAFSDASFGKTPYPWHGGVVLWRNGAVAWHARKLKITVPDSTCMIELYAINATLRETEFVANILEDMSVKVTTPHVITDSKSALDIIMNPGATKRSVHYERWLYFARDAFLHNRARFFLFGTDKMMADGMTKVVDRLKFFIIRTYIMNLGAI